ncbi:MAG: HAMP domain-containing sensor histidine kinase, partial [Cyanobacteriota bacterium]
DLSKIDAGKMDFSKDIFLASDYINENISMIKPQLKSKNITLEINTDKQPVEIIGDKRKCNQIMLNLLSNAFKYTPENGKIIVSTKLSKTGIIEFSVIDNGVGIKKEDHNKIFEEFYQADHDRDQALGGAGIGLALTKKLVNLHKGSIGVKSKPGKGSKFWFTLPINS